MCDLHLRPYPGTDGALALCMGNVLIQKGWIDKEYIDKYVHGFKEYAQYAAGFNETNVEKLTGVPYELVVKACEMIHEASPWLLTKTVHLFHTTKTVSRITVPLWRFQL